MNPSPFKTVVLLSLATTVAAHGDPNLVNLQESRGRFQIFRNSQPYFIKGAGGGGGMEKLTTAGGNSIRTWGIEGLGETLDRAQRAGLTVCAGIWLGQVGRDSTGPMPEA